MTSLQETKKELTEAKTKVETNTEGVKANRNDIQTNRDDIQQLRDELKDIKDKQADWTDFQNDMDDQNIRVDRHMDRQEIINRRSNIIIFGVLEGHGRRRENTEEVVVDILQTFMPDGDWQPSDCVAAYRAGRRDDSRDDRGRDEDRQARPIIATLDRPSDVGFILRHRQGREEMRKQGLSCAQDLSRAQQQKIRDIKQEGKQAYYFKGRLIVKDNPYNRFRNNNNRNDRRNTNDNIRYDRRDRPITRRETRQEPRRGFQPKTQERNNMGGLRNLGLADKTGRADKTVQTTDRAIDNATTPDNTTAVPVSSQTDGTLDGRTAPTDQPLSGTTDQGQNTDTRQEAAVDRESVDGSQSNATDTSGRASGYTYERANRPRYRGSNSRNRYDNSRNRYDYYAQQQQQQAYSDTGHGNRRQTSGDRRNTRRGTQQQWRPQGYNLTANYFGSNATPYSQHSQSSHNVTPPSFLQAPHLQHLSNVTGAFMPPPPPPPPPQVTPTPMPQHFYPPHTSNTQRGIQEMSGEQWRNMWQSGDPVRSFASANGRWNERRVESGQWGNEERARRMRGHLAGEEGGTRGFPKGGRNTSTTRRNQPAMPNATLGGGSIQNVQNDQDAACVCGCEPNKKKKVNKDQAKMYSQIVIDDSDDKSQPDTEESEYEECVESVSSSEEESESDGKKAENDKCNREGATKAHISGAYFGTHSLYDSAKVVDITDRVRQMRCEPMKATDQVLEINVEDYGARDRVTLPDPVKQPIDPIQSVPEVVAYSETESIEPQAEIGQSQMSSQSTLDPNSSGHTVTTTAQIHVNAEPKIDVSQPGQSMSEKTEETERAPRGVKSAEKGHSQPDTEIDSQSLASLEKQVEEANERAAEREGDKVANDASGMSGMNEPRESGSTPTVKRITKQAILSPEGLIISTLATDESEMSESAKQKTSKPKGKKKAKPKKNNPDTSTKKSVDQEATEGPNTRSKNQTHST